MSNIHPTSLTRARAREPCTHAYGKRKKSPFQAQIYINREIIINVLYIHIYIYYMLIMYGIVGIMYNDCANRLFLQEN